MHALWLRSARAGFGLLLPEGFDWSGFDGSRVRESLADPDRVVLVAGEFDGYGTFASCRDWGWVGGEVYSLFVDPDVWGRGVADAVMASGLERLADRGFDRVCVWSFVVNERANAFYARWGFRDDGAREHVEPFAGLEAQRLVRAP